MDSRGDKKREELAPLNRRMQKGKGEGKGPSLSEIMIEHKVVAPRMRSAQQIDRPQKRMLQFRQGVGMPHADRVISEAGQVTRGDVRDRILTLACRLR